MRIMPKVDIAKLDELLGRVKQSLETASTLYKQLEKEVASIKKEERKKDRKRLSVKRMGPVHR